ncbi:MAG: LLM class F420-dependent oxidoreductase, partial [Chloroflexota bacterium]|nr:LLM class F420-dependent oxidoreductase [Chloroflexota bacterium]
GGHEGLADHISALLDATKQVVVATGIVSVWTHPAEEIAAEHDSIRKAHPDRFLLGLGVSHASVVERAGLQYRRPLQKMVSYLDQLDAANPPVPKQERVLAALGPRMLELSRNRSWGAHPYFVTPEHTRRAREALGDGALLAPEQMAVLETDPDKARAVARQSIGMYLAAPNYTSNLLRLGFTQADFADGGSDRLVDAIVAWGDASKILSRVNEHHDAGADHVCIQILSSDRQALPRAAWRELARAFKG